jgi:hypothetical protein
LVALEEVAVKVTEVPKQALLFKALEVIETLGEKYAVF